MTSYAEFRLRIEPGTTSRSYRIVAGGQGSEASGRFELPFSELELENFVLRLGRTRRGTRRVDSPEMALARSFGTKLFDAVFAGDVRELYRSALAVANDAGQGLRVTLAMTNAPELLQVPWEYLYDRPNFLSISTWTPIVRYLDLAKPPRPLQIAFPLRILGMVSAPSDAEPIKVDEEKAKLEAALAALVVSGAVSIDWLEDANLLALARQLRRADYHVFHYIGHGGFDADSKDGVLLFEDEHGRSERVSGAQLGDILHDEKSLRLAVLNACEGARASVDDPFSGVATSLIEREIPAVIGMQFEITDRAAIVFASEFYSTLADGQPVDSAISEARKSIYAMGNDIEWGTPVLFMRIRDGRLFDLQAHGPVPRPDPVAVAAAAMSPAAPEGADRKREAEAAELAEAAERDRLAAERDRLAAEAAERDRLAAEAAERDRLLAEAAERDRLAAEAAERDRLAAEAAERDRLAAEAAERDRLAAARAVAEAEELRRRLAALESEAEERRQRFGEGRVESEPTVAPPVAHRGARTAQRPHGLRSGRGLGIGWVWLTLPILGLAGLAFSGVLSSPNASPSPTVTRAPTVKPTANPPTAAPKAGPVLLPNIYKMTESDGLAELAAAGFTHVDHGPVCSGSVDRGLVREVIIDDGSPPQTETELVTEDGPVRPATLSTPLFVKISTGNAC